MQHDDRDGRLHYERGGLKHVDLVNLTLGNASYPDDERSDTGTLQGQRKQDQEHGSTSLME
jgi:hypothetical protein